MANQIFNGFPKETTDFLINLRDNNNKVWFEENREIFTNYVVTPFQMLLLELAETVTDINPNFEVNPKVGKGISRIYRDVRFSKDKSPYRTCMWLSFSTPSPDWKKLPGFFFELGVENYRYGMGYYAAEKETMQHFRKKIENNIVEFEDIITPIEEDGRFQFADDKYKKILNPDLPSNILEWYQRKNIALLSTNKLDESIYTEELPNTLKADFKFLEPLYHFMEEL